MPSNRSQKPQRGDIWLVNFNSPISAPNPPAGTPQNQLPTTGDEIYKTRPAVVMTIASHWNLQLEIVVPVTSWQARFQSRNYFWMVKLPKDNLNNLRNDSAANAFQVKSVSTKRFLRKTGALNKQQIDLLAATIAFCVGYTPPKSSMRQP